MKRYMIKSCSPFTPALIVTLLTLCLLTAGSCYQPAYAAETAVATGESSVALAAIVNNHPITVAELDAYASATGMERAEALDELIDLQLIRSAAAAKGIKIPTDIRNAETRARVEYTLAKAVELNPQPETVILMVDHAWLKDASDEKGLADGGAQLEQLRNAVLSGETIPAAFARLQFDGSDWHIGDHEEYQVEVLPAEIRELPLETLSPVIAGDGGRHLFKIHQRRELPPPVEEVRQLLRSYLYQDAAIEKIGDDLQ